MLGLLGDFYAYVLGWPVLARFHKGLFYLSARALGLGNYKSFAISGEQRVARHYIAEVAAPVVFDVGANNGDWLAAVRRINERAQIHAFEPQAALAARIAATHMGVYVINAAVGDSAGSLDLYDYADHQGSQHASLISGVIDMVHGGKVRHTKVPVVTLDDYCSEHGISHIDFLKIDVEGFEFKVLQGARRMLEEQRVDVIQFEFNEMNVVSRAFLGDFGSCFRGSHQLYRLLPHGLLPLRTGGHWFNEQFVFQNIIAIRKR